MHEDKIIGTVLGEAIGDALGHPGEFIEPKKRPQLTDLPKDNTFTDDTQMFCAIGEALLTHPPHLNEEAFMQDVAFNFAEWLRNPLGGSHRAPGGACREAARKLSTAFQTSRPQKVFTWRDAGDPAAKGNGSAMRSGVVGAMYWSNPEYAFRVGCLTSVPTHNNLESILGAGLISYLVALSIRGEDWNIAVGDALKTASDFEFTVPVYPQDLPKHTDPEIPCPQYGILGTDYERPNPWYVCGHLAAAYAYANSKLPIQTFRKWNGDDNAVIPAVAAALFFNTRFSDFLRIAIATVNYTGDCDTTGAIAGCLAGARFGAESIKEDWRRRVEMSDYLHDLADRIAKASQSVEVKTDESYEIEL